jgi:hypothetical protein
MYKLYQNFDTDYLKIFLAALCWMLTLYCFVWPLNYFMGVDAYYHIKIAEIMKNHGLVLNAFPWADCSIWRDNFFDKDWLFHIYLIPFTLFGKLTGGKLAILTAGFIACISWGVLLKSLKIKNIFLSLIIMLSCYGFYSRMFMCRGHLLSIVFFPICLACIIKRKQILLFVFTLLYSLAYAGSWQILPLALLFDFVMYVLDKEKFSIKKCTTLPAFLAIFASVIFNPYFPNNVNGLIVQNFFVLKTKWFGNGNIVFNLGNEFNPISSRRLYTWYLLFFVLLFITLGNFFKSWKEKDSNTVYLGLLTIVYFTLSVISVKFSDYSVPVGFTFFAIFWDRWLSDKKSNSKSNKVLIYSIYIILFIYIVMSVRSNADKEPEYEVPLYSGATEWLVQNLPENQKKGNEINPKLIVFTGGWDDAPMLFYGAPQYKYLIFLDPCFMYTFSPDKYLEWQKIVEGRNIYPAMAIYKEFNADLIFLSKRRKVLAEILEQSPYTELCYKGTQGEKLFRINITEEQLKNFESTNKKYRSFINK